MEARDWQRVEDVFHAARALEGSARAAYLERACAGDGWLRVEVESLVRAAENDRLFLERPAFSIGMKVISSGDAGGPAEGELLGPYKILRMLGEGGMGKVYLAEDTRLGRNVALKFISRGLSGDAWAKRRLVKEAQAAAMLEHPNICTVYGLEEAGGHSFIVMQFVEGETLAQLKGRGPVPAADALRLATQIVGALESAHGRGIVHRDIKPQNMIVAAGGGVKVLDFGLAKITQPAPAGADASQSFASAGLIVGTIAYMSPEQLRGEEIDARSDIFSFGVLLYELVCGHHPFMRESESNAEVISSVLTSRPTPPRRAARGVPFHLSRVIERCMEKDRGLRYQSAGELLEDLGRLRGGWRARLPPGLWLGRVAALALALALCGALLHSILRPSKVYALAVLPVANGSADPGVEYLNDGLTEGLTGRLSRLSGLRVRPPSAVAAFRGRQLPPGEAARQLGVDTVLATTVSRRGDALMLHARLLSAPEGRELWGENYDFTLAGLPSIEKDISEKVASHLGAKAPGAGADKLRSRNPDALQHYLYGRHLLQKRDRENVRKAIDFFNKAIESDPAYAQAHAALAESYLLLPSPAYGSLTTKDVMYRARSAAVNALEIDEALPEAHTSLGVFRLRYEWNWGEAERDFKRAVELDPNSAMARYWHSNLLVVTGRFREAVAESEKARDLDPYSSIVDMNLGRALYFARQYDRAAAHLTAMLQRNPNDLRASYVLGYVYQQTRQYDQALSIFEKYYPADKELWAGPLGYTYARMGRRADALRVLGELEALSKGRHLQPHERALIYIGLNDAENAFKCLEESYAERFASMPYLATEPIYDNLRSDARYSELIRRMNLTP